MSGSGEMVAGMGAAAPKGLGGSMGFANIPAGGWMVLTPGAVGILAGAGGASGERRDEELPSTEEGVGGFCISPCIVRISYSFPPMFIVWFCWRALRFCVAAFSFAIAQRCRKETHCFAELFIYRNTINEWSRAIAYMPDNYTEHYQLERIRILYTYFCDKAIFPPASTRTTVTSKVSPMLK